MSRAGVLSVLIGVVAGLLAFWLTTSRLLLEIDWDNAAHHDNLFRMFNGRGGGCGYGTTAWTCGYTAHMALVPVYGAGAKIAMLVGGDILTGMRLVNSVSIGGAAALLALLVRRLGGGALLSVIAVGAFLFTENVLHLARVVEDDAVSLVWMSGILYLCIRDGRRFTPPVALGSGALLGVAALTNYPMLVWAPVVLAAATVYARPDLPLVTRQRLLLPALVVAGFAATVALYGAWVHLRDPGGWPWATYWSVLRMEPNELAGEAGSLGGLLEYVSARSLATSVRNYPTDWLLAVPGRARFAGSLLIAAAAVGVAWPLRRGPAQLSARGRAVSMTCLALIVGTVPAAWKNDVTYFERMSHVPLCLTVLLVALSVGPPSTRWYGPARRNAALVLAGLSFLVGVRELATAPRSGSWLARFESLERRHGDADAFVFAESEFGALQYDRLVSLGIAVRNPIVLSPTGDAQQWAVRPFTVVSPDEYRLSPPERPVLSDAARTLVAAG